MGIPSGIPTFLRSLKPGGGDAPEASYTSARLLYAHASQVSTHMDVPPHLRLAEKNNNHDAADEVKSYLRVEDVKGHKRAKKHKPGCLRTIILGQKDVIKESYNHNIQKHT